MSEEYITGGGGGATTVARVTGNLSTLSSQLAQVLVVAAGGGGSAIKKVDNLVTDIAKGGSGGGFIGGDAEVNALRVLGTGATQAVGYGFGQGQPKSNLASGGGSGLYGGYNISNTAETQAFSMNSSTGNDAVRYDSSDIVYTQSGINVCHGQFADLTDLTNPLSVFEDGVITVVTRTDGCRGWVYDTSLDHRIIPPNCIVNVCAEIMFISGDCDFDLNLSDASDVKTYRDNYRVALDFGANMPQKNLNTWYRTKFSINMVNGILQNYTFYVNDEAVATGTLNQHMVNVDEDGSIPCSVVGLTVWGTILKLRSFYISWEERV